MEGLEQLVLEEHYELEIEMKFKWPSRMRRSTSDNYYKQLKHVAWTRPTLSWRHPRHVTTLEIGGPLHRQYLITPLKTIIRPTFVRMH